MKLQILNEKDIEAIATVCGIYSYKNMHNLIRTYVQTEVPEGEDFECDIANALIPATYRYNPSLLAQKIQSHVSDKFKSSAGTMSNGDAQITILLRREEKKKFERFHPNPSVKQIIKEWIELNAAGDLDIPLEIVPAFFASHPEQLAYQIHKETGQRIRIKRFKTIWKIIRK